TAHVRKRDRPRPCPYRHRRAIQRDSSSADLARRTRRRRRRHRHARCAALPKKHFDVAAQANIALIVQTKDNQPTLHQKIQDIAATEAPLGSAQSRDKGRNRGETRTVSVFDPADKLADTDWHAHIAAVIRGERDVFIRDARTRLLRYTTETAFSVANTPLTAP